VSCINYYNRCHSNAAKGFSGSLNTIIGLMFVTVCYAIVIITVTMATPLIF
jgi:hypothetical protein